MYNPFSSSHSTRLLGHQFPECPPSLRGRSVTSSARRRPAYEAAHDLGTAWQTTPCPPRRPDNGVEGIAMCDVSERYLKFMPPWDFPKYRSSMGKEVGNLRIFLVSVLTLTSSSLYVAGGHLANFI